MEYNTCYTDLTKYAISKFVHLTKGNGIFSDKYKYTNGLILINEMYDVICMIEIRNKTKYRFKTLLQECLDTKLKNTLVNDIIFRKYYKSFIKEIKSFDKCDVSKELPLIKQKVLKYKTIIDNHYILQLKKELNSIDIKSKRFDIESEKIDNLLQCLISLLVYKGYSIAYLQTLAGKLNKVDESNVINSIINLIPKDFNKIEFEFFIENINGIQENQIMNQIMNHLSHTEHNLDENNMIIPKEFYDKIPAVRNGYIISIEGNDPYDALNKVIDVALKISTIQSNYIDYKNIHQIWTQAYYKKKSEKKNYFVKIDSLNVNDFTLAIDDVRVNTLELTLSKYESILEKIDISRNKHIEEAIYFFNQAHIVPSIENSYILLWTALESTIGYMRNKSDIELIKDNIGKMLALGVVGRRCNSFFERYKLLQKDMAWTVNEIDELDLSNHEDATKLLMWLIKSYEKDDPKDPYNFLKKDPLLCKLFREINEKWNKMGDVLALIEDSTRISEYQCERLYLIRNKIVHSGKNHKRDIYLWGDLEWYVGKLLAYMIWCLNELDLSSVDNTKDVIFSYLKGQYDLVIDYLQHFSDSNITYDNIIDSNILGFPLLSF